MKFEDKLVKLRKKNNMSQEQLADKLNVSRQAVSKWESGGSYPEMDKLIQICKLFNCSLDDLTNDKIDLDNIEVNNKNKINNFFSIAKDYIKESVDMFSNINSKQIIKMIFEMLIVVLVLCLLKLPIDSIYTKVSNVFYNFGDKFGSILSAFWEFIIGTFYIIVSVILFFYIYKVKFLDKYSGKTIENVNNIEENNIDQQKENLSKNNYPKHFSFIKVLGQIIIILLKIGVIFFMIPIIIAFVFLIFGFGINIWLLIKGVCLIGTLLLLISGMLLILMLFILVFDFIFNKSVNVKQIFILFITGLFLLGVGGAITFLQVSDYKVVNERPNYYVLDTYTKEVDFNNNYYISNDNINYIVDNNLNDKLKVEVKYNKELSHPYLLLSNDKISIMSADDEINLNNLNNIINDLKHKTIYNYYSEYEISIYTSSVNIDKLKANYQQVISKIEQDNILIEEYENKINNLEDKIDSLKDKNNQYEDQINDCQTTINDYKSQLKEIIEN